MVRKTLAETPEVKQVGVDVELLKDSQSDVVADILKKLLRLLLRNQR